MQRTKHFSILGILVLLGVVQTGCGTFGLLGSDSPQPSTTNNSTTNPNTEPIASAAHDTKPAAPPAPVYPSFGLGVTGPEVLALNERLAELGYLPVKISDASEEDEPQITLANIKSPPKVTFQWRYGHVPSQLLDEWSPDTYTAMTRAAVIALEHVNGLPVDGLVGPQVWKTLLSASVGKDPNPYTFVLVTKNPAPEELHVWKDGKWVYKSLANTGVPKAPSTNGTFAVYRRFLSQTMKGTNPDGTKYVDKGVRYVNYYDGGEAIHAFPRPSYGYPQSVGCVELPTSNAKVVWSLINYGTVVTVEGQYVPPASKKHTGGSSTSKPTNSTTNGSQPGNTTAPTTGNQPGNSPSTSGGNSGNSDNNNNTNNTNNTTSSSGSPDNNTTNNPSGGSTGG